MADNLQILIQTCIELGSAKTLETLGISSGEDIAEESKGHLPQVVYGCGPGRENQTLQD